MAGEVRTCTNCGNQQATGAFCERCGTRLPEVVQPVAAQQNSAPPTQYAAQPQQDTQPQYAAPRPPGPFSKLFDLSFQGFITRGSLRVLFISTLALLGVYWLFALIFGIVAAAKIGGYWCLGIFSSLALVTLMIIWTRIMMELTMTAAETREEVQKAVQAAEERATQAATEAKAAKAETKTARRSTSKAAPKATASRAKTSSTKK